MTTDRLAAQREVKERRGIQSVVIGLRILSAIAAEGAAVSLSNIGQRTGLSASQTHRYLSSLMTAGMVKQQQRSGLYDLDAEAIRIGLSALARIDVFRLADDIFGEFSRQTGRTVLIAIWGDAGPTIVRWFDGAPAVITSLAIGSVLPLMRSATGRIFYTYSNTGQITRLGNDVVYSEEASVDDPGAIRRTILAEQTAFVSGDLIPGLNALAAPVFDLQGRLTLVATAISSRREVVDQVADRAALIAACTRLTENLGGSWPTPSGE